MHRFLHLLVACLACSQASAARPPLELPRSPAALIERLPRGYARLEPAATSPLPPLDAARQLLAAAASTGDARLATRAQGLLDALPARDRDRTEALRLRAFSAQHRHDFATALALLDRLVARDPRDADGRLSRAQVNLVQGRIDEARADCAALALGVDAADGMLCAAALSLRLGKASIAAMLAERWLASVPAADPRRRHALVLRADAASRAGAADADGWYRQALALDGNDVRTLAAYARHLRGRGQPARALALLARAPATDGLSLERALSARAAGSHDATALAESQGRRYALAHAVGAMPELRDEAEYLLTLRGDATAALVLAERNFASQRDAEDVDLLRRAASAARRPDVLARTRAWALARHLPFDPARDAP
jgi:Tfp pilus assembly protein PilF